MSTRESHPSMSTLYSYCDGTVPDFEETAIEEHLAGCEECLGVLQRMDSLLFSGFTVEAHAAALQAESRAADPLVKAIRGAARLYREYAAGLHAWLGDPAALWGSGSVRPFGEFGLAPVSGGINTMSVLVALQPGESRAAVDVRESGQTVEVQADVPVGTIVLLFRIDMSMPDEETPVRLATFEPEGQVRIAHFYDTPAGSYHVAIAPVS